MYGVQEADRGHRFDTWIKMETLEIHSKAHLIKWVEAPGGSVISWQVKPIKKSINFGIFRHSKARASGAEGGINHLTGQGQLPPGASITDRLQSSGLEEVIWHGRCDSGVLLNGSYGVKPEEGGMFALVFDNTFSKTTAKTVLFSQKVEHPLGKPESNMARRKSSVNGDSINGGGVGSIVSTSGVGSTNITGSTSLGGAGSGVGVGGVGVGVGSTTSVNGNGVIARSRSRTVSGRNSKTAPVEEIEERGSGIVTTEITRFESNNPARQRPTWVSNDRYMTGVMLKKRRKRLQGYGRRYFSLDRKYGLLNYYLDQKSSFLRGSMPINLCAITAIEATREIIIDSGMETWNLRAVNNADWKAWTSELDTGVRKTKELMSARASLALDRDNSPDVASIGEPNGSSSRNSINLRREAISASSGTPPTRNVAINDSSLWATYDGLVNQLRAASADAKRTLAELDAAVFVAPPVPNATTPPELQRRPSFWRRKSRERLVSRSKSGEDLGVKAEANSSKESLTEVEANGAGQPLNRSEPQTSNLALLQQPLVRMHDILSSVETLVGDFEVFGKVSHNELAANLGGNTRDSIISENDVFFDATEDTDGVVYLSGGEGGASPDDDDVVVEEDDESDVEDEVERKVPASTTLHKAHTSIAIEREFVNDIGAELYPLPVSNKISRRSDIRPSVCAPPSLIGLLRKNVGKDLSSVAMPVTCNEPITILQRFAEMMEYSELLDRASNESLHECERALLVATFAVSGLACQRCKERALRKPFNPLLGETYELVREDKGFRLIAEKVSHRPPVMAIQVESKLWTVHYTARPDQKYWGKSMELTDKGAIRIHLKKSGDTFEYFQPSLFLRNIIAGEKYVEPVGSLNVESTKGVSAVVEYKQGGMFSGRSESLSIRATSSNGRPFATRYEGKWTENISDTSSGKLVWQVGELVRDAASKYGYTKWTASLNEVTSLEQGQLPPTDSRLRRDQRKYETGDVEGAESLKLHFEEQQRIRRKQLEQSNEEHVPAFFRKEGDSFVLKDGADNYWTRRQEQNWKGLVDLFDTL